MSITQHESSKGGRIRVAHHTVFLVDRRQIWQIAVSGLFEARCNIISWRLLDKKRHDGVQYIVLEYCVDLWQVDFGSWSNSHRHCHY